MDPELVGERYLVLGELARGGMGVVYRVRDLSTGAELALKRVRGERKGNADIERLSLEREFKVLADLDHPGIVRAFDYGADDRGPYYTMELLRGEDLRRRAPVDWRLGCAFMRDVASSLALLHARQLVHRDLSPANVKVTEGEQSKLLDFGALSAFGPCRTIVGTPPLVPPEALHGERLDHLSDLYALGALLYWTLTGHHAFPVATLDELEHAWQRRPPPPSAWVAEIPKALDTLVLELMSADRLARPNSAAAVIDRLEVIASLRKADQGRTEAYVRSFLRVPPFVGRDKELALLESFIGRSIRRESGSAVRIEAAAGTGRTRLLTELALRAKIAGAAVVQVDGSSCPERHGLLRAIALRILEVVPERARRLAARFPQTMAALGREVALRAAIRPSERTWMQAGRVPSLESDFEEWVCSIAAEVPLLLSIDNIESNDDSSASVMRRLGRRAPTASFVIVTSEQVEIESLRTRPSGSRDSVQAVQLSGWSAPETEGLIRKLFGDAPNVKRVAKWIHDGTGGVPLHVVEVCRQLVASDELRYVNGAWQLPADRPSLPTTGELVTAMSGRFVALSESARTLARCLSLVRVETTQALCEELVRDGISASAPQVREETAKLLRELSQNDIVTLDVTGYRFTSTVIRAAILADMTHPAVLHQRLGRAFAATSREEDLPQRLEAGWHFMQSDDPLKGARMAASTLTYALTRFRLSTYAQPVGPVAAKALEIFRQYRCSIHERIPLLISLVQAGYYEDLRWYVQYADETMDALDDVCGTATARRLSSYIGSFAGLFVGLLWARARFCIVPTAARAFSFGALVSQLLNAAAIVVGSAAISLDPQRAARLTLTIAPFAALPQRASARALYDFCWAMTQTASENPVGASQTFERLITEFTKPSSFPLMPKEAKLMMLLGAHFALGCLAVARANGVRALECASVLEASGVRLYVLIASQLRFLYHALRGEMKLAEPHGELVEQHAAHVGSAWQVEMWQAVAMIPLFMAAKDTVGLSRIERYFESVHRSVRSMDLYRRLTKLAADVIRAPGSQRVLDDVEAECRLHGPRTFLGWSQTLSWLASVYVEIGRYEDALRVLEPVLASLTDEEREYVTIFGELELQGAIAEAGLGRFDDALNRISSLLQRFEPSGHPIVLGGLYEARGRIAVAAGLTELYRESVARVHVFYRAASIPSLVAKLERLAALELPQLTTTSVYDTLSPETLASATQAESTRVERPQ